MSLNIDNLKDFIATTASVSTILQFLTGTLVCQKIVANKSTGELSSFPFVSGCLSTALWLRYGFFMGDSSLILVNTIGASLFFAYVVTFYIYSFKKSIVIRQFIGCLVFLIIVLLYLQNEENSEIAQKHLGVICCIVTILFFAAPFATLMHVIRVKNAESLPFPIIFSSFVVSAQWLMYGLILKDKFIQIPNFLGCVLSAFQLSLFWIYPKKPKDYYSDLQI